LIFFLNELYYYCFSSIFFDMDIETINEKLPNDLCCIRYLEEIRRNGVPKCPYCNSLSNTISSNKKRYHCNKCNTSFSVTVGTIFHHTRVSFQKWFLAVCLITWAEKPLSSRQLATIINVNSNTAWYMNMRIRKALIQDRNLITKINEISNT